VIGIAIAPFVLGEPFTALLATATVVTLLGVILVQRG